jgi:hypothetical protein
VQQVRVVYQKWGARPHWEFDALRLGDDQHGTWLGVPADTVFTRPGREFRSGEHQVVLLPRAGWTATFYDHGGRVPCDTYVDVATVPVDEGDRVVTTDLDLDVLRGWTGRVWVDDEDEFALHRVRYGYPDPVVRQALETCRALQAALQLRDTPFDGPTATGWLHRLTAAIMTP